MRWWRLPIEECACRKTDLGGGDYYLRNSGLPPLPDRNPWQINIKHLQYQFCKRKIPIFNRNNLILSWGQKLSILISSKWLQADYMLYDHFLEKFKRERERSAIKKINITKCGLDKAIVLATKLYSQHKISIWRFITLNQGKHCEQVHQKLESKVLSWPFYKL